MKIKFAIKTCLKNKHKLEACMSTWTKDQDVFVLNDVTEQDVINGHDFLTNKWT